VANHSVKLCAVCGAELCAVCGAELCAVCGVELWAVCGAELCAVCGVELCAVCGAELCAVCGAELCAVCGAEFVYFDCWTSLALVINFIANLLSVCSLVSNTASQHPAATSLNNSFYILFNADDYTSLVISDFSREVDGNDILSRNFAKNLPLLAAGNPRRRPFSSITVNFPSNRLIYVWT
jgi:hypothetical protein